MPKIQKVPYISTDIIQIERFDSVKDIHHEVWNQIVGKSFYANTDYLSIIENNQSAKMDFLYFLVKVNNEYLAAIHFQYIHFELINAVNNLKEKNENKCSILQSVVSLAKSKQFPLLQSGNIFFTEDDGMYFKSNVSENLKVEILEKICDYIRLEKYKGKSTSIVFSGFHQKSDICMEKVNSLYEVQTEPNLIMNIQSSWKKFDDYTQSMSSKYRQRVNKVYKQTADLEIKVFSEKDIQLNEDQMIELYKNVANHASFNMAYLTKGYFVAMKLLFQDQFIVKGYYLKGELIGFTSAFYKNKNQYVHFIGMNYEVNDLMPLYHRILLEFVYESILHQHQVVYLGRTATEIKTTIGAEPIEMYNYIRLSKSWYMCMAPKVLHKFGAKPYIVRRPFKELQEASI
jgi:predicted N-acyltransferase